MLASPPRRSTLTATLRSQTNHSRRVSLPDQRFILLISHVADPVKSVSCLPVAADPGRQGGGIGVAAATAGSGSFAGLGRRAAGAGAGVLAGFGAVRGPAAGW